MQDLEAFRDKFHEPPEAKRPEDVDFPREFLHRVYGIASIGWLFMCITVLLHFACPAFLNLFYTNSNGEVDLNVPGLVLAGIVFPVAIPLLYLNWKNRVTTKWMITFACIFAVAMGTVFAILSAAFHWEFVMFPLLTGAFTFAMMSGWCYISPVIAQGKYSFWVTYISGFSWAYLFNLIADAGWMSWVMSFTVVIVPCYLLVNLVRLKQIAYLKTPPGINEKTKALIGGFTVLFSACMILFPFVRMYNKRPLAVHRHWVGPEDTPIDGPARPH